ncbi:MAG: response regulator transcription factor [Oscillospiraceae bacterium]|nr:response regulator transcription factor [Oscillospiraceae bacterium]
MTAPVIAIVDDDVYIGDMLEELLRREGYGVLRAYSGTEALMLLEDRRPDLILLDLMLPGLNGEEVLPHLTGIPVIVLSARAAVEDKVDLLQGGAADYLTKPFDTRELLARVAVQLRRQSRQDGLLRHRGIVLAPETREAAVDGGPVRLTRTEFSILKMLMQNPKQVITKSQLLEQLSVETPDCVESSLKVHVSNLRRKLREAGAGEVIEAVWGIGFKLAE